MARKFKIKINDPSECTPTKVTKKRKTKTGEFKKSKRKHGKELIKTIKTLATSKKIDGKTVKSIKPQKGRRDVKGISGKMKFLLK